MIAAALTIVLAVRWGLTRVAGRARASTQRGAVSNHAPRKVSAWSVLCRVVGLAGLAAFFVAAFTPVPNLVDHWLSIPAQLEPADALVVLGAGIDDDGTLTNNSMRRA